MEDLDRRGSAGQRAAVARSRSLSSVNLAIIHHPSPSHPYEAACNALQKLLLQAVMCEYHWSTYEFEKWREARGWQSGCKNTYISSYLHTAPPLPQYPPKVARMSSIHCFLPWPLTAVHFRSRCLSGFAIVVGLVCAPHGYGPT